MFTTTCHNFLLTIDHTNEDLKNINTWFKETQVRTNTDVEALEPAELALLCKRMRLIEYDADTPVFTQGEEGDALYIIFSGKSLQPH